MQEHSARRSLSAARAVGLAAFAIGIAVLGYLGWPAVSQPKLPPAPAPTDFRFQPTVPPSRPPRPDLGEADPAGCGSAYLRLYDKPTLEITIAFGYKDARPARYVGDRYESALVASYLLAPCTDFFQACGFQPDPRDGSLFIRDVTGPDGKPRTVRVRLVHSAAGPDDEENRTDGFQSWMSRQAERAFFSALSESDVVFYNGHSRDGGGPDFAPPKLRWGHPDYSWYAEARPGERRLLQALEGSVNARLLGLFSCASTGHFVNEIRRASPKLATLTSGRLLYYADAMRNMLGALSALIGQWCPPDLDAALRTKAIGGSTSLIGFLR